MEEPTSADLTDVLACLSRLYGHCDEQAFPKRTLEALRELVPCEMASFELRLDAEGKHRVGVSEPFEVHDDPLFEVFEALMLENPLIAMAHETGRLPVVAISDLTSRRDYEGTGVYHDYFRHYGLRDQLGFALPGDGPELIGVALNRERRGFSDRDRRVLRIVKPHLIQAWRNAQAVGRLRRSLQACGIAAQSEEPWEAPQVAEAARMSWIEAAGLTPREAEVLAKVAAGLTNRQVGQALSISARTVTKHLENVFPKLGVTTRAAAAALYASCSPCVFPADDCNVVSNGATRPSKRPLRPRRSRATAAGRRAT